MEKTRNTEEEKKMGQKWVKEEHKASTSRVNTGFLNEKFEKNKKIEIFLKKYLHFRKRWCILNESTAKSKRQTNKWPVGQGVKTSPSHGENTGSIPVLAATK